MNEIKKGDKVASAKFPASMLGVVTAIKPRQGVAMVDTFGTCGPAPVPMELAKLVLHKPA